MAFDVEVCHAVRLTVTGVVPHDEVYVCCTDAEWPSRRNALVYAHPDWFTAEGADYGEEGVSQVPVHGGRRTPVLTHRRVPVIG